MKIKSVAKTLPCFTRWNRHRWSAFCSIGREVRIGVLAVSMLFAQMAFAEEVPVSITERSDTSRLKEIKVIAKRAYPANGTVKSTTIYETAAMSGMPMSTLESALKPNPAIDVRERGGHGVQADISLYGSNWDQTMIMLNGIDFTDARTGHQSNSLPIDLEAVSKISVVTDVIGAGAYSGGVNYVTSIKKDKFIDASIAGGEYGYCKAYAAGGMRKDRGGTMLTASYARSDGYKRNTDFNNLNLYSYSSFSPRMAGHEAGSFEIQAGFQRRQFGSYGFYSLRYPWQWEETKTFISSGRWQSRLSTPLKLSAYASYRLNTDLYELFRSGYEHPSWYAGPNHGLTHNVGVGVQADYQWTFGTTSAGVDYAYNKIYSNVLGYDMARPKPVLGVGGTNYTKSDSRSIFNYWLRQTVELHESWAASVSANIVDSPYGTKLMWSGAFDFRPSDDFDLNLSGSRTMRLPTFTDLFYSSADHIGNPNLRPEVATTMRLHATYAHKAFSVAGHAFYRWGTDIIDWLKESGDSKWEALQYGKVNTAGFTLTAQLQYQTGWLKTVQLAYGYLHNTNDTGNRMSQYDVNYMRNKFSAICALRPIKGMELCFTASFYDRNGSYFNLEGNSVDYPSYWLVDARLSQTFSHVRLYVDATNLLNQKYYDFGGLEMPPLWLTGGITVSF